MPYNGHFSYNGQSVRLNAPDKIGVYYCGYLNYSNQLIPLYIGRAIGIGVTLKSRLLDHLREDRWPDVTHFGYNVCLTKQEAESLERSEINEHKPKYNDQLK